MTHYYHSMRVDAWALTDLFLMSIVIHPKKNDSIVVSWLYGVYLERTTFYINVDHSNVDIRLVYRLETHKIHTSYTNVETYTMLDMIRTSLWSALSLIYSFVWIFVFASFRVWRCASYFLYIIRHVFADNVRLFTTWPSCNRSRHVLMFRITAASHLTRSIPMYVVNVLLARKYPIA